MIQAAYFSGVQEANQKIRTDVTHLMERVSNLESQSVAMALSLEQLQDTVEKTGGSKLEAIESQMTQISSSLSELNRKIEQLQLGVTNGCNGSSNRPSLTSGARLWFPPDLAETKFLRFYFRPNPTTSSFQQRPADTRNDPPRVNPPPEQSSHNDTPPDSDDEDDLYI